jgi:hypothetical protein
MGCIPLRPEPRAICLPADWHTRDSRLHPSLRYAKTPVKPLSKNLETQAKSNYANRSTLFREPVELFVYLNYESI